MSKFLITFPLFIVALFGWFNNNDQNQGMTYCGLTSAPQASTLNFNTSKTLTAIPAKFPQDAKLSYTMPMLTVIDKNTTMLSWTEKDENGETAFCMALSKNNNLDFSDKKVIFKGMGIGNSRMMRAKVLVKKDGKLVAVFSNREESASAEPGKRPKRASNIVYCESSDNGNSWTMPKSVDADRTLAVRGFFDAIVLPNNEIAVIYLKDVENSTKHEERNLRLALTKNGIFQPERVIDPVVCDCCPINLYLDKNGFLNVIYRDNNNDIRDMARMVSKDHGQTFSKPEIVFKDNWKISGCPHQGAISTQNTKEGYLMWFNGAENEKGYRLTTMSGKNIKVLNDATAKEPWLLSNETSSILLWQQNKDDQNLSSVVFSKIKNGNLTEPTWLDNSSMTSTVTGIMLENELITAREVMGENKKNTIEIRKTKI